MNHASLVRGSNKVLSELARVTEDLASVRRQLGFVRAEEKRNWSTAFAREFAVTLNVAGSSRIADAETAPQTAERYQLDGDVAALEVERDFLMALLEYDNA